MLDALHAGLRIMLQHSPVMDPVGYGRGVGAAYERIWLDYVRSAKEGI